MLILIHNLPFGRHATSWHIIPLRHSTSYCVPRCVMFDTASNFVTQALRVSHIVLRCVTSFWKVIQRCNLPRVFKNLNLIVIPADLGWKRLKLETIERHLLRRCDAVFSRSKKITVTVVTTSIWIEFCSSPFRLTFSGTLSVFQANVVYTMEIVLCVLGIVWRQSQL